MKNKNYFEAAIISALLESFLCPPNHIPVENEPGEYIKPKQIAVITPFTEQASLLQRML